MDTSLLIKIDVVLTLCSLLGGLYILFQKSISLWRFRKLHDESKQVFRNIKGQLSNLLSGAKNPVEAEDEKDTQEKIEVTPDDHVTVQKLLRRVEVLLANNDLENSEKLLVSALGYNPEDEDTKVLLAFVYMKRRKYSKAESIYLDLIENNSNDPTVFGNLGKVLEAQDEMETAEKAYIEAIKRDPHNAARFVQLGRLYMKMDRFSEAVAALEEAVRLDTRNTEYLFLLARGYELIASFALSGEVYLRILDIEPYNEKAKVMVLEFREKGYMRDE